MPDWGPLIAALILERPLCMDCIAVKNGLTVAQATATIERLAAILQLRRQPDRCRACGETRTVYSIARPTL